MQRTSTLRGRLLILFLVVFIPFVGVQTILGYSWVKRRYEAEVQISIEAASAVRLGFSGFVRDVERQAAVLGESAHAWGRVDIARTNALLDMARDQYLAVHKFVYVDSIGTVLSGGLGDSGTDMSGSEMFRTLGADSTQYNYLGDLEPALHGGGPPGFIVARAVRAGTGTLEAVVFAYVEAGSLGELALNLDRAPSLTVSLLDRRGNLVYTDGWMVDSSYRWSWGRRDPLARQALEGKAATGIYRSAVDSSMRIGARLRVRELEWIAGASRPYRSMVEPVVREILMGFIVIAVTASMALWAGFRSIRTIGAGVDALRAHAGAVAKGEFRHQTGTTGIADFDELVSDLNRMGEQLEIRDRNLRERTAELQRSNTELEQFAYISSHDLQEPLRTISGYLQLLERRYTGQLDKDADEFIEYSVRGAQRLQSIINDILAFSRIGTRGKPFSRVDLNAVVAEVIESLKGVLSANSAVVDAEPMPEIVADANQMRQLFQNLIGNAVKFRREEPPRIRISAVASDSEWRFSVADNGIGIEPQYFQRIFVAFKRLHAQDKYPGTGIGLAICRKIVERHGGRIWVESQPGEGSTFQFTIPRRSI